MIRSDNMIKHNNGESITSKPTLTHFSKYGLNISELSLRVWVQGCETAPIIQFTGGGNRQRIK